jgi:energy-coupling factor transport system ATP-binding protein
MEGSVRSAGMDTRQHAPGQFAGQVGLVLQNPANQLSNMRYSIYEEVAFGLENLGLPRTEMPGRIEHALEITGLTGLEERSPFNLSGGQQQRLALASVLALEPPILLLDEPTAMLDPQGSKTVFEIVSNLAHEGATVIIASHSLEWIASEATSVIVLSEGKIVLNGSPEAVLSDPLLEETGIGRLRYTRAAEAARQISLWPAEKTLPVSLEKAVEGFRQTLAEMGKLEDGRAHSD